jgi:hypothetical protein
MSLVGLVERRLNVAAGVASEDQRRVGALVGTQRVLRVKVSGRRGGRGLGSRWPAAVLAAAVLALAWVLRRVLAGVLGVGRARAALPPNCTRSGNEVTCKFSFTGAPDQTFEIPAGVSSVNVVAVGAPGGGAGPRFPSPVPGGAGAVASGTLKVTGGQTLYVEVGGSGGDGWSGSEGGFNGGGPGDFAGHPGSGGGGGGSDVRTAPYSAGLDPDPRLLVAGGGGGAGAAGGPPTVPGGGGGAAGEQGLEGSPLSSSALGAGGGGLPGTTSWYANGGTGGTGGGDNDLPGEQGGAGGLGGGGGGTTTGGGGGAGGGGLNGGGQGGQGARDPNAGAFAGGGGGGGGSSLVPAGGSVIANTTGLPPVVTISYTVA